MRTIIAIDQDLCTGCGLCVDACHEGAIALVDGKAKLMFEHYCDGLGDCLPACPTGAITFEERMAAPYDEAAVAEAAGAAPVQHIGCPGAAARAFEPRTVSENEGAQRAESASELAQWPVQIKLVSPSAPYFKGTDLLVAADCTAFAYGAFHRDFMAGKVTIIGCPKLDAIDYADKLTQIVAANDIGSITVARMSVPCCGGIERAVREAVAASGRSVPISVRTIDTDGALLE
ncbi:ATP-binding protein [Raoultibacter phocaeensis]|uniref:ATP-binding protein n=1 Tax=Raoultibacter phocaeensis TaxID=2479841 RepID=UPI00111949F5|nr:4Fe-4S binding protein [Raoultibacter phocaeensis]